MSRHLITAPTADVVSVDDLKVMLGISGDTQDGMLEAARDAVVDTLDPASGGWLGRALRPQTWELRLDQFPACEIMLPFPPLISLTSVKYYTEDGTDTTLTVATDYRVFGEGTKGKAYIQPAYNDTWPIARTDPESVRIRYVCGYAGSDLPSAIVSAVALGVRAVLNPTERNLYLSAEEIPGVRNRRWTVSDAASAQIERSIGSLLSTYRVW